MDQKIIDNAKSWANNPYFQEEDRREIISLIEDLPRSEKELTERFYRDLEFGTGGLRAPLGMGQNRMNRYNVRRATQAMANTLKNKFSQRSAVISYDSRNFSKEFALEAAGVFAANNMKAYVFKELTPTPMLSFGIRALKAQTGIMITASHNPPIYNGFKAFWNDGAQVTPPTDKEIINEYNQLTDWNEIKFISSQEGFEKGLIQWVDDEVEEAFYQTIEKKVTKRPEFCLSEGSDLFPVYTALHGSAGVSCGKIARRLGFKNFYSLPEQALPDGNFPTVKSPNPEDPKAMAMAIDYMIQKKADIAFGTDPDGDRLGVVVNHNGKAEILNGNQIGALMLYYVFSSMKTMGTLPEKSLVIKSIVTSPLQNAIAESFNAKVMDTLTGFKWMAALIQELEEKKSPYEFVFASEESFGYMPHCESRDKDAVSSLALMCEVALFYKKEGKTLVDVLDDIYQEFGFFYESLLSFDYEGKEGAEKIQKIMEYFRNYNEAHLADEEIMATQDYLSSEEHDLKLKTKTTISLPKSNVLSFTFSSGNKLFLRPSGTEPKIKFYTMVNEQQGDLAEKKMKAHEKVKFLEAKITEICSKA